MADTIKAAVLHKIRDVRIEDWPAPGPPCPDEARVRIHTVGVCGSDVHYFERGRIGPFVAKDPLILGHEVCGIVEEVGSAVKNVKPGDAVAIEPGVPCRHCEFCHVGRYNVCRDVVFMGTPPIHGAFREAVNWAADFLFKLPDGMPTERGALVEPLAVGLWSCRRGEVKAGDTVAVLGCGTIGLMTLQAAIAEGATTVIASDVIEGRLELAKNLGATHVINAAQGDFAEAVGDITSGRYADVVLECAGTAKTQAQAVHCVKAGGIVVIVGLAPEDSFEYPIMEMMTRECDIRGVFRYANVFEDCVQLIAAERVNVEPMITKRFTLDQTAEALAFASEEKATAIKVAINVSPD